MELHNAKNSNDKKTQKNVFKKINYHKNKTVHYVPTKTALIQLDNDMAAWFGCLPLAISSYRLGAAEEESKNGDNDSKEDSTEKQNNKKSKKDNISNNKKYKNKNKTNDMNDA